MNGDPTGAAPVHDSPEPDPAGHLLDQPFTESSLYGVRAAVAAHLADRDTVDIVVLLAHELASNAVRHGGGSGRLRLWVTGGAVYCQVVDRGPGIADPAGAGLRMPLPSRPGGRGLWIIRRLADLHISTSRAGSTVTAVVALHPTPPTGS
ncbi:ATP-binding protein [Actinoplanes sp. NPDC051859]|uniref:ATP-binding protein n=1 Tax=Actinoplanes sp. NPDC051859 TaxID=3363909 RepID=UPI0037A4DBE1